MNNSEQKYRKAINRSALLAISLFALLLSGLFVELKFNLGMGAVVATIIISGILIFYTVRKKMESILCNKCLSDLTLVLAAIDRHETVKYCPYCGDKLK